MFTKNQLEYADNLLSILQRVAIVVGVAVGAIFFFLRLEHTPSVSFTVGLIGVDRCTMKLQLTASNVGKLPFSMTYASVAVEIDGDKVFSEKTDLELTAAAGEALSMVFSIPASPQMNQRIAEFKVSAVLMEDGDKWRIFDTAIPLAGIPADC